MNRRLLGTIQMTITALIWGTAFVAQSVGMDHVGPWTFICTRNIIGSLVLIPVIMFITKAEEKKNIAAGMEDPLPLTAMSRPKIRKMTIIGGICSGFFLFTASLLQQYGICETSVGKAGFITALYIIMVPFISIILKKKIGLNEWISAIIAIVGFYIMSIQGHEAINRGDLLIFFCAILFSAQILCVDYFVDHVNPVAMSSVQFAFSAVAGAIGMMIFEKPDMASILAAAGPIMYAGFMSSGVAYTLQIVGQKNLEPTLASLLMSLESVFAALTGWLILKQAMSCKEIIGSLLVFAGVILAQIPVKKVQD